MEAETLELEEPESDLPIRGIVGQRLSLLAFRQMAGNLAGYPFVKVVVDRTQMDKPVVHFINYNVYQFHSDYIAEAIMGVPSAELDKKIDEFNQSVYLSPDRHYLLGIVAMHKKEERFFTLETVEIDTMDEEMVRYFYKAVRAHLDRDFPLLFKPANHNQESIANKVSARELPRIFAHELHASSDFLALNPGCSKGRLRVFLDEEEYRSRRSSLEWFDIIVMERVPDDIPRLSGIINATHTTPLSHTNVLASGWQVPNCVQLGIIDEIQQQGLNEKWVRYTVEPTGSHVGLEPIQEPPPNELSRPAWAIFRIKLEEPQTDHVPIVELDRLRLTDRFRYGTKAAHLGELSHLLETGSERLLGFYKIRRPPRPNLLPHLARFLGASESEAQDTALLTRKAMDFLRQTIRVPRGIALPFSLQQEFLESSPRVQQTIGKLKMALQLNAPEVEPTSLTLMNMVRTHRMPDDMRERIDSAIANHLAGVGSFVVRSSSNAEDLENFSAAGIYESHNHVTSAEAVFQSIKDVWSSLFSPRSVRLRQEVGISLDDCWMGVIVQEEMPAEVGGVLVTHNPMNRADFRNVYVNVSTHSVDSVVHGVELPLQYIYNTVEGGGRTLSLGASGEDLDDEKKQLLHHLAYAGRLLQSHFSPNYTFSDPVDIEWLIDAEGIVILQLRPYTI
ncbi:MAG: PEP/pyruvate-binding domain-containing protein [Candidatus Eremiobacterota bacterium]